MKLDYCAVHSAALIAPGGEPNCLFIRHDDGRIMTSKEVWAEIERLQAERDALLELLRDVCGKYADYRAVGYGPGADQYQRLVGSIRRATAALAAKE